VSDKWMPVSPVTGRLDAFQWRVPLADLTPPGPVIEDRRPSGDRSAEVPLVPVTVEPPAAADRCMPAEDVDVVRDSAASAPEPARPNPSASARPVEAVIPLVHVPDDPGPEPESEAEPIGAPPPEGWRRLRSLFG
jgi:HemY protein